MEQARLVDFLDQDKGLYIEGCDFGFDNRTTELYQKFGCAYVGNGNDSLPGNVNTAIGQTGTITEGKNYTYLFQEAPDKYVDEIAANQGTIIFECQNSIGRAVIYDESNTYRAIHSTFIFGALRNGVSTRDELMGIYLNYLMGN